MSIRKSAARKPGIEMGEDWYCSSRCFSAAVEERLLDINLSSRINQVRPERMPLHLLLFRSGCLTHSQSVEAAHQQKTSGGDLKDILLRLGYVTEEQITQTRALQAGYPVYSLGGEVPGGHETLGASRFKPSGIRIPRRFMVQYAMVPIHYVPSSRRLLVGFVHRIDHGLLYAVEHMTDCAAEPCFLSPADFDSLLSRNAEDCLDAAVQCEEIRCNEDALPRDMARVISSCAVQMSADEARLRRTGSYLWARLRSESREVDLLFPKPWSGMGSGMSSGSAKTEVQ